MNFKGKVIHGQKRGGTLPTLNLDVQPDLEQGVYAVWVLWGEQRFAGAMNWGPQPTFDSNKPVLEIHLLEGEGDWYGRGVKVEPVQRVREVKSFESKEELREQIQKDVEQIQGILYNRPNEISFTPNST